MYACVSVCEDKFDTHRCLDNLSTVLAHLKSGLFVHIRVWEESLAQGAVVGVLELPLVLFNPIASSNQI